MVRGRLYDFEEVDGPSISALVSMEFDLYERKTGKVVWSHYYSQSEPVQGKEMSAIVSALDTNLDRGLKEVAAGLNQYFLSNPARRRLHRVNRKEETLRRGSRAGDWRARGFLPLASASLANAIRAY